MIYRVGLCYFIACLWSCRQEEKPLFTLIAPAQSGVDFTNHITEYDTFNIFNTEFIYNGGGVAIGDLNGDRLPDIFFTGNQVDNKLFLNRGKFSFKDITQESGLQKPSGQWSSGINLVDINNDRRLDIYVCNTMLPDAASRANFLYINQGNNSIGIPQFIDQAEVYGLADTSHASNAQFFDYDRDGDLDVFIAVNVMDTDYPNAYKTKTVDGSSPNCDRLYRQDQHPDWPHAKFVDVSLEAGLVHNGYSHSSLIMDFNADGWPDIYVANDYVTNDLIYINQKDGTFKNEAGNIFKHQAASAMGSDAGDLNNDGLLDVFTTEMMPYYNKRKKLFLNANNYNNYINNERYGYDYQYPRNTLQLNLGLNQETGWPMFGDVAFMTGTQETEWSWTPLIQDFDHNGWNDLFVTNGFPRDVTDHDFGAYRSTVSYLVPELELQAEVPQIKTPKFIFSNSGNLIFKDVSQEWGVVKPAFSNGAAWGDLDGDGDLDLIVNNINDPAFIYKNELVEQAKIAANYVRLVPDSSVPSADIFGLQAVIYYEHGQQQSQQIISSRGYLSCSEYFLHFGLGAHLTVDSVRLIWSDHQEQIIINPPINRITLIKKEHARPSEKKIIAERIKKIRSSSIGLDFIHRDSNFIDFNFQRTLPHKYSEFGPSVAVGDVNGDGLDDVYVSGSAYYPGCWFWQKHNGTFSKNYLSYKLDNKALGEEIGTLLFDADNDGDLDLYLVHGGNHAPPGHEVYRHVLAINDGKGHFQLDTLAIPFITQNGTVVRGADYDRDGDVDLFVGGSIIPQAYPLAELSYLLRNESVTKDSPRFVKTDFTAFTPGGIVSDALWTDFNGDTWPDLIIAGEWMPLTFLTNREGTLVNETKQSGLSDQTGWWTTLTAADFDQDGDMDYLAGNYGQNTYFKASAAEPLRVYAKDFDGNGLFDPFISLYWSDSLGHRNEYMYHTRDDAVKQLVKLKAKFQTYGAFGEATMPQMFTEQDLQGALVLQATQLSHCFVENQGNGVFALHPLPALAQIAPWRGMITWDVDQDGDEDVIVTGNDYGMELLQGRADAWPGMVLINQGHGIFGVSMDSGFRTNGDGRSLALVALGNEPVLLAMHNRGLLEAYNLPGEDGHWLIPPRDASAVDFIESNRKQRVELNWGKGFLSQSTRKIWVKKPTTNVKYLRSDGQIY